MLTTVSAKLLKEPLSVTPTQKPAKFLSAQPKLKILAHALKIPNTSAIANLSQTNLNLASKTTLFDDFYPVLCFKVFGEGSKFLSMFIINGKIKMQSDC